MDKYASIPKHPRTRRVDRYTDYQLSDRQIEALRLIVIAAEKQVPAHSSRNPDRAQADIDAIIAYRGCLRVHTGSAHSLVPMGLVEATNKGKSGGADLFTPTEEGRRLLEEIGGANGTR